MAGDVFLRAEWRDLVMLNYEVSPSLVEPFVPAGTELDEWHGKVFISIVGFRFLNTRVCGISFPFHRNFDEINLRLYVRRTEAGQTKRGVVFVREVVPRLAIANIARALYNERYIALPTVHRLEKTGEERSVEYGWKSKNGWNRLILRATGTPTLPAQDSEQQFITEHYWGYSRQRDGGTVEYQVTHEPWRVWNALEAAFEGDAADLYGETLAQVLRTPPSSAFLAEGSEVTVSSGHRVSDVSGRVPVLHRAG
jgi:uncharacterized protein YqjF (DUF2071 family)